MAKRKIFDVSPPGTLKKEKPKKEPKKRIFRPKIRLTFAWKPVLVMMVFFALLFSVVFFIKSRAEIDIWPEKDNLQFEVDIMVDSSINEIILNEKNWVPGEMIKKQEMVSQGFPATGVTAKSTKARGTVRVYNAYSTVAQPLIAQTRFVSDGGKLFRTSKRVVVPGAHYEGGKLVPGEIDILVEAGEPGEEYNIGPSTFSLPGLAGTASYTTIYAKSFSDITGGIKDEVSQVTQEDLDDAQDLLENEALAEAEQSLKNSISQEDYIILEGAVDKEVTEIIPLAEIGQEAVEFTLQVKARAEALVFQKSDLEEFAKLYILSQISQDKKLIEGSLAISYSVKTIDLIEGKMVLGLEITGESYTGLDESSLKNAVMNKRVDEIRTAFRSFSEINKISTRLWPFWVTKAPKDINRIQLNIIVD